MRLIACMACRNEDWIIGLSLRVALLWNDAVIVYLHACTDCSRDIVEGVIRENERGRVTVIHDSQPTWDEMPMRQSMLQRAREHGATHVSVIDCDEVLTGNLLTTGAGLTCALRIPQIPHIPPNGMLLLPGYNLRAGITKYHTNGIWSDRWFSLVFRDDPRLSWSGDNFHSREPRGIAFLQHRPIAQGEGGVMHLWGASERRLKAKSCWYKMTETLRWPDKSRMLIDRMYSWAMQDRPEVYGVTPEQWAFRDVPDSWWKPYAKWMQHLSVDLEPWQVKACEGMLAKHGREQFAGLDLFGIV